MTANLCVVCGSETPDGYACVDETEKARQQLAEIAELVAPARAVAHRQTSGDGTGGGGVPGSRVPIDLAAGARLDAVQVALTGWARELAEGRNVGVVPDGRDVIVLAAAFITQSLEIARHKPWVDEMLREIGDCVHAMRSVTGGRRERIYLGVCGAPFVPIAPEVAEEHGINPAVARLGLAPCPEPLYGRLGASKATCKACGAQYDQEERITDRSELAHSYAYTAVQIEQAYPGIVHRTNIGRWRKQGLLTAHGEADGNPLYAVADVLALAKNRPV